MDGEIRRSYVLWREFIGPLIALEFASGDGEEERDQTPLSRYRENEATRPGKFWVYERIMRIAYYGIYEIKTGKLEVYNLVNGFYRPMNSNERGHYPLEPLGVELGLWEGTYQNQTQLWLRWWDWQGNLLLIGNERAELERERAELAEQALQQETQARRDAIPRLLGLGLSVEQVAEALSLSVQEIREGINS